MKLKKFLKIIDPIVDVVIWTSDDKEKPAFEGSMLDIPFVYMDYKIGRKNSKNKEEPIYINIHKNKYGAILPIIVINLKCKR